jgi:hypothetical protein
LVERPGVLPIPETNAIVSWAPSKVKDNTENDQTNNLARLYDGEITKCFGTSVVLVVLRTVVTLIKANQNSASP